MDVLEMHFFEKDFMQKVQKTKNKSTFALEASFLEDFSCKQMQENIFLDKTCYFWFCA